MVSKDSLSSDLGDEIAILNLKGGAYYGMNTVGARIWSLIQEPKIVEEICRVLVNEYDVEPHRCERDLIQLLQDLANEGLIEVKDV